MDHLIQHIESLIFVAEKPISLIDIKNSLDNAFEVDLEEELLLNTIADLTAKYDSVDFAIQLVEISNGFQFLTKPSYHNTVGSFLKLNSNKKLSRAALETLSIIAYRQPVTRTDMEKIRGVSCDYSVQKLLEKELVEIIGRSEGPGRPLLYGTSERFMEYFGLKSINDLPKLKEIQPIENQVGEAAPIMEDSSPIESHEVRVVSDEIEPIKDFESSISNEEE